MSFTNAVYFPFILILFFSLSWLFSKYNRKFALWVNDHWFYKTSPWFNLSFAFFLGAIFFFLLTLLDLRGPEKQIQATEASQKTIILIDSSASMLAEDVRPNRFNKALFLARHFSKLATGHQISVVVFSDHARRIVPFTKDIDLIDSRISGLEDLRLNRGGTGLRVALQESLKFIGQGDSIGGNILIFTDGEETSGQIDLEIPENISVAMVGVGTAKGATIPLRSNKGVFMGNKKFQGQPVVTKLNEKFFKDLAGKIENFKYWIASSYSLPTRDILSFFQSQYDLKISDDNVRIRPVLFQWTLVPGLVLFILSMIFKFFPRFTTPFILYCLIFQTSLTLAQPSTSQQKEPVKNELILKLEEKWKAGGLSNNEKLQLSQELLKQGFNKKASQLYGRTLSKDVNEDNYLDKYNYASSLFKSEDLATGLKESLKLRDYLEKRSDEQSQKLLEEVKKNIVAALQQSESSSGKKDEQNDENGNQDEQDGQSGKDGEEKEDKEKSNDEKGDGEDQKDDKQNNDQGNEKDKKDKQDKKGQGNEELKKEKVPAILNQLKSDDAQLQKKLIDAETTDRKSRDQKDW